MWFTATATALVGLMILKERREKDLFLIKIFALVVMGYLLLPQLIIRQMPDRAEYWTHYSQYAERTNQAIFLFVVSVVLTYLLVMFSFPRLKELNFRFSSKTFYLIALLYLISVGAKVELYQRGFFWLEGAGDVIGTAPPLLKYLSNIHLLGFNLLVVLRARDVGTQLFRARFCWADVTFWLLILYTIAIPALQGRRAGVALPIILLFFVISLTSRIRKTFWLKVLLTVSCIFFAITILRSAQVASVGSSADGEVSDLFAELQTLELDLSQNIRQVTGRVGSSYLNANRAIFYSDKLGVKASFDTWEVIISGAVPRFINADKPPISIGNAFGKDIEAISSTNDSTGINPGWVGEAYFYNGMLGVFLFAVLYGFLLGGFSASFGVTSDSGLLGILCASIFIVSGFQMEIAASLLSFLKSFTVQIALVLFLTIGR
ncbi:hypothetical protein N8739_09715 [Luminiphilus sp.]|nr:hypothetical protein [Luminiphilus sp.]